MTQADINIAEWKNPNNWGGPRLMRVYFSKKDTRVWIPKPIPVLGWTLNLAQKAGSTWFSVIVFACVVVAGFAGYYFG